MLTSLGRFLRKLRIDQGEILKDMADKLGVSVSFLSAVENGKKRMPPVWNTKLCDIYQLTQDQKMAFTTAIAETEESFELDFYGVATGSRELAISFARKFPDFDEAQVAEIKKILQGEKDKL